jgi:hypothetical protein
MCMYIIILITSLYLLSLSNEASSCTSSEVHMYTHLYKHRQRERDTYIYIIIMIIKILFYNEKRIMMNIQKKKCQILAGILYMHILMYYYLSKLNVFTKGNRKELYFFTGTYKSTRKSVR